MIPALVNALAPGNTAAYVEFSYDMNCALESTSESDEAIVVCGVATFEEVQRVAMMKLSGKYNFVCQDCRFGRHQPLSGDGRVAQVNRRFGEFEWQWSTTCYANSRAVIGAR